MATYVDRLQENFFGDKLELKPVAVRDETGRPFRKEEGSLAKSRRLAQLLKQDDDPLFEDYQEKVKQVRHEWKEFGGFTLDELPEPDPPGKVIDYEGGQDE